MCFQIDCLIIIGLTVSPAIQLEYDLTIGWVKLRLLVSSIVCERHSKVEALLVVKLEIISKVRVSYYRSNDVVLSIYECIKFSDAVN